MATRLILRVLVPVALGAVAVPIAATAQLVDAVDDKVTTLAPASGQAVVVMRLFATEMSGDNRITWMRLADGGAPDAPPVVTKDGFRAKFSYSVFGGKKDARMLRILVVPAGRYVMVTRNANSNWNDSFCFGSPAFEAAPNRVTYIGDYEVFMLRKMWDGQYRNGLKYTPELEEARTALAARFPTQAAAMQIWKPVNGVQFDCVGDTFTRYDVPVSGAASAVVARP